MAPRTFLEGVLAGLTGRQGISDQSWSSGGPERSGGGAQRLDLAGGAGDYPGRCGDDGGGTLRHL